MQNIATESVCPDCLKRIPAHKEIDGDRIYLVKECPDHGIFRVLIWQGEPGYRNWTAPRVPSSPGVFSTRVDSGCPFDCGLCPEHRQETCCVLLEITQRCNLHCPVCFASTVSDSAADPDQTVIESWYRRLLDSGGNYNIQLSGGEPTVRDDLPEIIQLGHKLGFDYIQLNTNGLRLAKEPHYVEKLRDAGLNNVFLQFDGMTDNIYEALRGAPLLDIKKAAIDNCATYGIGVVLVPTVARGINLNNIGDIIRYAVKRIPDVRGVHFQPISYFGRYPFEPPVERATIPELLREIEKQTAGLIKKENLLPAKAENAYCSFHGNFVLMPDCSLKPLTSYSNTKCCTKPEISEGLEKTRLFVAKQWSAPKSYNTQKSNLNFIDNKLQNADAGINTDSLDVFIDRVSSYSLVISGMAFQDAWTLELERLKECNVLVFHPDGRLIPFCAYNLTAKNGKALYRNQKAKA
ncbi:MAG: radical SAM protein [Spirochaetota bacterium]